MNISFLKDLRDRQGILVADSYKVASKIVASGKFEPLELYYEDGLQIDKHFLQAFNRKFSLTKKQFEEIKGKKFHKGIIGIFKDREIPEVFSLESTLGPFVILNGVSSPENVGSIMRTLAGLGFKTLILDSKTCRGHNRRVVRVSMGNFVYLDLYCTENIEELLLSKNVPVYATANDANAVSFLDWRPQKGSGFVIGSEGHGIEESIKLLCDLTVRIPIAEKVQHLNAGHSCAIIASRYLN